MPSLKRGPRNTIQDPSSSEAEEEDQGIVNDSLLKKVNQEYLNQPIDLKQGDTKLKQLVGQYNVLRKNMNDTVALFHNVAGDFAESLAEEFKDEEFDEDKFINALLENPTMKMLDQEFRVILNRVKETSIRTAVISDVRQRIVQGHQITNLFETYQAKADKSLEEWNSLSTRDKFLKHKEYIDFITHVWEQFSNGASMPNMKKFLPRPEGEADGAAANGEDGDSDEELEIGAQSTDFRCPLTASILEDPYTSLVCPHSFSGDAIREYITSNGNSVGCPVAGCSQRLNLVKVERDEGLKRRVEGHLKRLKQGRTASGTQGGGGASGAGGGTGGGGGRTYVEMEDSDED